jgi:hypothetical protein
MSVRPRRSEELVGQAGGGQPEPPHDQVGDRLRAPRVKVRGVFRREIELPAGLRPYRVVQGDAGGM